MTTALIPPLEFVEVASGAQGTALRDVVAEGLSQPQKCLPCRFFYDEAGSALFEQICELPEYYLTRTEQAILERSAGEMAEAMGGEVALVELGSGSSRKTRLLLDAVLRRQRTLRYFPIDISRDFLRASAEALLEEYPRLRITAIAAEYDDGIRVLPHCEGPRVVLFMGSNIGNFEPDEAAAFLGRIRSRLLPQDRVLLGVDLLKDPKIVEPAYNDSAGVTAAFNRNLLARINRELGGCFNPALFTHHAPFVAECSRIEMRLVSRVRQQVLIRALDRSYGFREGEYIHTENSHKYAPAAIAEVCRRAGLAVQERWLDGNAWFAVMLLRPA